MPGTLRISSAWTLSVVIVTLSAGPVLAASYKLDLMTATGSRLSSIDSRVSINDAGTVAFAAFDTDGSKLFVADSPGAISVISFPTGSPTRLFSAAAINNASPAVVATVERVSGAPPTFIVRKWAVDKSGSVTVGNSGTSGIGFCTGGPVPGVSCTSTCHASASVSPFASMVFAQSLTATSILRSRSWTSMILGPWHSWHLSAGPWTAQSLPVPNDHPP
jgi:hypothetical protein